MRLFKISDGSDALLAVTPVKVQRYGERTWAVYFGGDLLCVTVYLKGAMAVQALIERMQDELRRVRIGQPDMPMSGEACEAEVWDDEAEGASA